jgi:RimJ/RimL family protein N-acetyltransferase
MIAIEPVTLAGRHVRLEPLGWEHEPDLVEAGADPDISRWLPVDLSDAAALHLWLEESLATRETGTEMPFAVIDLASGRAIGSTRFMDIRPTHNAAEIGWTWYATAYQRTAVNSECKLLLLTYLFERAGCVRVCLKTDRLNERSQRAIERIGGVYEGTLRKHMVVRGGRYRDSVYYSILDTEWPQVKERLEGFLARTASPR